MNRKPGQPFREYAEDVISEMHFERTRAIGIARFYLKHGKPDKALERLDACSARTREMGTALEEERYAEFQRAAVAADLGMGHLRPPP